MKILRFLIASFGGYLFTSLLTVSLALVLPFTHNVEAISLTSMLSFVVWLLFILYAFSSVDIKKLLLQLLIVCIILYSFNTYFAPMKG